MKRILFTLLMLAAAWSAGAQDRIVKRDSSAIEAKVLEVTTGEVRYKRFSNPDGPTYVLPKGDILHISYANGETETFPDAPVPSAAEYAPKSYEIGDYYAKDGVRGVICALDESGRHGLILSLGEKTTLWYTAPEVKTNKPLTKEKKKAIAKEEKRLKTIIAGASNKHDGEANMQAVARCIEQQGLKWENFPAFAWCREQGEGWYLPSVDEWLQISFNFNGGSRSTFNRQARTTMNDTLKAHGGKRLDGKTYYFTSTEHDAKMAVATHLGTEPPYVSPLSKSGIAFSVRAVKRF